MTAQGPPPLPRLMLVTDRGRTRGRDLVELVAVATRAGLRLVQVRERDLGEGELHALGARLQQAVVPGTRLVINGSLRVATSLGLGLHLSAEAPRLGAARARPAPYGRSVHDDAELALALEDGADYVLGGTVFPTASKPGRAACGPALIERLARQAGPRPIFAIGGITVGRVPAALHAGAWGVAVSGAILGDNDPARVTEALLLALEVSAG